MGRPAPASRPAPPRTGSARPPKAVDEVRRPDRKPPAGKSPRRRDDKADDKPHFITNRQKRSADFRERVKSDGWSEAAARPAATSAPRTGGARPAAKVDEGRRPDRKQPPKNAPRNRERRPGEDRPQAILGPARGTAARPSLAVARKAPEVRIISGQWRGRPLASPPGTATRPTSDRAREGLFSMLASRLGSFEGLQVADLFAGTGALGLEALSRGAAHCLFVEKDRTALAALEQNIAPPRRRSAQRNPLATGRACRPAAPAGRSRLARSTLSHRPRPDGAGPARRSALAGPRRLAERRIERREADAPPLPSPSTPNGVSARRRSLLLRYEA